jgi:hypothetical protein
MYGRLFSLSGNEDPYFGTLAIVSSIHPANLPPFRGAASRFFIPTKDFEVECACADRHEIQIHTLKRIEH